jgi:hypothetical protein
VFDPSSTVGSARAAGLARHFRWVGGFPAPFMPLTLTKRGKEIDYEAKTVKLAGRRYIVCRNHQEASRLQIANHRSLSWLMILIAY